MGRQGAYLLVLALGALAALPATAVASLSPSPTSLDFGNVDRYGTSPQQQVTFTNNEATAVTVGSLTISGDDAAQFSLPGDGCSNAFLNPGDSCTVSAQVTPSETGSLSASLDVPDDLPSSVSVPLAANSQTGTLSINPDPIAFNPQPWFFGSQNINVSVQNSSFGTQIGAVSITGPDAASFVLNYTCANTFLNAFNGCNIGVGFNPTAPTGPLSASLVIASDSASSPNTIPITAEALVGPIVTASPLEHEFGAVQVGSASATTQFTLGNVGDFPAQIQQVLVVSGTPQMFPVSSNSCALAIVIPGENCTFEISFAPTSVGLKEASVFLITNTPAPITQLALSGEGLQAPGATAAVEGTAAVGEQLDCVASQVSGELAYEWLRAGAPIPGADRPTYTPAQADAGQRLACRVTATNALGSITADSPETAPVAPRDLSADSRSFVDTGSCRVAGVDPIAGVRVSGSAPATPESPLTFSASRPIEVELGRFVRSGSRVTFTPRNLAELPDGPQSFSVDGTPATLVLAPCDLSVRVDGADDAHATFAVSGSTGIGSTKIRTPRLAIRNPGASAGSAIVAAHGSPQTRFPLSGRRTRYNGITVRLARHSVTVRGLPVDTGTVEIELSPGLARGRGGTARATAEVAAGSALATARVAWR